MNKRKYSTTEKDALIRAFKRIGVIQSLSRPHVPQVNAVFESFFRTLKSEAYYPRDYCADLALSALVMIHSECVATNS